MAGCGQTNRKAPHVTPLRTAISGFDVGVSVQAHLLDDSGYATTVGRVFDTVTPENEMKWDTIHPDPHDFDFGPGDRIVKFAQAHDQRVRGHTLVWQNQLPGWLAAGHYKRKALIGVLRNHIAKVVGHYRGKLAEWDVVNEAVADDGTLRHDIWEDTIGPDYIPMAFKWAHEADPSAKLVYNDYGAETPGPKADGVYRLVKTLKEHGAPVDAIGLQVHVTTAPIKGFVDMLKRYASLGLDVELTEVDVRVPDHHGAKALQQQAAAYKRIVEGCRSVSACHEVVFWGLDDADSWVPGAYPGFGDATLFDGELNPKPAYQAVLEALRGGGGR